MVAIAPFTAKGIRFEVPEHYHSQGRGSGRANAWMKGVRAAARGAEVSKCPYEPGRGSGSWRKAWLSGHGAFISASSWRECT